MELQLHRVCHQLRLISQMKEEVKNREVEIMLKVCVLRGLELAYERVVLFDKKDGVDRFCVDFRPINMRINRENVIQRL